MSTYREGLEREKAWYELNDKDKRAAEVQAELDSLDAEPEPRDVDAEVAALAEVETAVSEPAETPEKAPRSRKRG